MTPNEYRVKHKRCATCVYCYDIVTVGDIRIIGNTCTVKQKTTELNKGKFCKVYKPKEFKK